MNTIAKIIKKTIENLNKKNIVATPANYENEFFKIISSTKLTTKDFTSFKEMLDSLDKDERSFVDEQNVYSFYELAKVLNKRVSENEVKQFLKHFTYFLSPSLDNSSSKEINKSCLDLANSPYDMITDNQTIRKFRKLTEERINKDKALFKDKSSDVKKLIEFLTNFFKKTIEYNSVTLGDVSLIKDEIQNLSLSKSSEKDLKEFQEKLLNVACKFEKFVNENSKTVDSSQDTCELLYEQIEKLQENLSKAEEEKSVDFLTGVLTRRAYSIDVEKIEREYQVFDSKYALIFYDIDLFKNVNDIYGHECGDSVLATFASILKKLTRNEDIIARYGGEEFVTLVHYKNKLEIKNYIRRVKNIITGNKFVHGENKLSITFSAGVSFRENYDSYDNAIRKADELLYVAKDNGRNQIVLDNDEVF